MTLEQFVVRLTRKVRRDHTEWVIHDLSGALRRQGGWSFYDDCPLTFIAGEFASVATCARRLGLRLSTANRIAAAADDGASTDGLRTRLVRAVTQPGIRRTGQR